MTIEGKVHDILIDVSNLYYKAYSVNKSLVYEFPDKKGSMITGGIYGFLQSIRKLSKEYDSPTFWYLFDNHSSKINNRKLIDPGYKKNRVKQSPEFYRGIDFLELILLNKKEGDIVINRSYWEADDLVKPVLYDISKDHTVLVYSEDMDYSRIIEMEERKVYWKTSKMIYNRGEFKKHYGFKPTESSVVIYKSFHGDEADAIPNAVPYLPKEILFALMESYTSVYDILRDVKFIDYIPKHWKEKIEEAKPRLILNEQLVSFVGIGKEKLQDFKFDTHFNPQALKRLYETVGFNIEKIDMHLYDALQTKKKKNNWDKYI